MRASVESRGGEPSEEQVEFAATYLGVSPNKLRELLPYIYEKESSSSSRVLLNPEAYTRFPQSVDRNNEVGRGKAYSKSIDDFGEPAHGRLRGHEDTSVSPDSTRSLVHLTPESAMSDHTAELYGDETPPHHAASLAAFEGDIRNQSHPTSDSRRSTWSDVAQVRDARNTGEAHRRSDPQTRNPTTQTALARRIEPSSKVTSSQLSRPGGSISNRSATSGGSSPIILTPTTGSASDQSGAETSPLPQELVEYVTTQGPCSNTWKPRKYRGRRHTAAKPEKVARKRRHDGEGERRPPRGPFRSDHDRDETAWTRSLTACIRCRFQKIRCLPDPVDPYGSCLTCQRLIRPTISLLPCIRSIITDASLYREQDCPEQMYTKRFSTMDLVDITEWASTDLKEVSISQVLFNVPYTFTVRECVPVEGDVLEERWTSEDGVLVRHTVAPYAIADIEQGAAVLRAFVEANVALYINALISRTDDLIWHTYMFAFRYISSHTPGEIEHRLLSNCFRLWMLCRLTSYPEHIHGGESLGGQVVDDPSSPFDGTIPIPTIISAQLECILFNMLRMWSRKVLSDLQSLLMSGKKKGWLTCYLALFLMLHSCAMMTRRDAETAKQWSLPEHHIDVRSIRGHQTGVIIILAHWHYAKGLKPLNLALEPQRFEEIQRECQLNEDQLAFVQWTAQWIEQHQTYIKKMKASGLFEHDMYWIIQLFDKDWTPGPTV